MQTRFAIEKIRWRRLMHEIYNYDHERDLQRKRRLRCVREIRWDRRRLLNEFVAEAEREEQGNRILCWHFFSVANKIDNWIMACICERSHNAFRISLNYTYGLRNTESGRLFLT